MKRRTDVDAQPCFLPLFMLFGLGGAARRGARPGMAPYGPGAAPYGANPNMYGPGMGPGAGAPNMYGAYGAGPQAGPYGGYGPYGGAGRWPMIF